MVSKQKAYRKPVDTINFKLQKKKLNKVVSCKVINGHVLWLDKNILSKTTVCHGAGGKKVTSEVFLI